MPGANARQRAAHKAAKARARADGTLKQISPRQAARMAALARADDLRRAWERIIDEIGADKDLTPIQRVDLLTKLTDQVDGKPTQAVEVEGAHDVTFRVERVIVDPPANP